MTPMVVDAYVSRRAPMRTPATVNREVQTLHHMFVKALEWGKALENPVRHQKALRVNNRRLRYLSPEEMARLLDSAAITRLDTYMDTANKKGVTA